MKRHFTRVSHAPLSREVTAPGGGDLFIATEDFAFLTDVGQDGDLPAMWKALEAVYRFSGGTFLLMQRMWLSGPGGIERFPPRAPPIGAFVRECAFWTTESAVEDGRVLLIVIDPSAREIEVSEGAAASIRKRGAQARPADGTSRLVARSACSLFWYYKM